MNAQATQSITQAQEMAHTVAGIPNELGIGKFTLGNVYGTTVPGLNKIAVVSDHPSLTIDQIHAFDAIQLGVNPFTPDFKPVNFSRDNTGQLSWAGPIGQLSSFYSGVPGAGLGSVGQPGAYDLTTGNWVGPLGIAEMGTVESFQGLHDWEKASIVSARRGKWTEVPYEVHQLNMTDKEIDDLANAVKEDLERGVFDEQQWGALEQAFAPSKESFDPNTGVSIDTPADLSLIHI